MNRAGQLFLFLTLIAWGSLIGGILYSHITFFPPFVMNLPGSASLVTGPYPVIDAGFWGMVHPVLITCILVALVLNWKIKTRRKFILIAVVIYGVAIITSFTYFVPELRVFEASQQSTISEATWLKRGKQWLVLSWIRAAFMYLGFVMLLIALTKNSTQNVKP